MVGKIAQKFHRVARTIYEKNGLDYTIMNVCGGRFARGLHVISFNRESEDERNNQKHRRIRNLRNCEHAPAAAGRRRGP